LNARPALDRLWKARWLLHPAGAYRWFVRPVVDIARDRVLGIDTALPSRHGKLGFGPERGIHYVASNWGVLKKILEPREIGPGDVLLDVGCGKGAVLCQAMAYPFARIIGTDLSPDMCAAATRNVATFSRRYPSANVAVVRADAATDPVPDDVTVVYLFNPFIGDVFNAFGDRLMESLARSPRPLRLVYNNPVMHDELLHRGFRLVRTAEFWARPRSVVHLYQAPGVN